MAKARKKIRKISSRSMKLFLSCKRNNGRGYNLHKSKAGAKTQHYGLYGFCAEQFTKRTRFELKKGEIAEVTIRKVKK